MNDQLTQDQINAMIGMNQVTPQQAYGALGSSNPALIKGIPGASMPGSQPETLGQFGKQIGQLGVDVANDAIRFGQSAVQAPTDIASELQGKGVNTATLPNFGGGQQTFQGEFQSKTVPEVQAGKKSPLAATAETFGNVLGAAANFIGLGAGSKAATTAAKEAVSTVAEAIRPAEKLATSRIASTADTLTTKELREEADRVLSSGKLTPSKTEIRAGQILSGKTSSNAVDTLKAVKSEISTRGQEAEQYLAKNAVKISNREDFNAFNAAKQSAEKYMPPSEVNAYDEQIGVFQKILQQYAGDGGYNTSNYYQALKDYESQVTVNLPKGKDALLVPGGSARIQAAKDVRTVVRNMIGEKNPDFKSKMFDLASLYDAEDNVTYQVAQKAKSSTTFAKRHPIVTGAAKYGAEAVGAGALYEGAKEIGAPLP